MNSRNEPQPCRDCQKTDPPSPTPTAWTNVARRQFLQSSALAVTTMMLSEVFPGRVSAQDAELTIELATYPEIAIGRIDLAAGEPVLFQYPSDSAPLSDCLLVRLGREAGGGVGRDRQIVAFSGYCTHMGGSLMDGYIRAHDMLGCGEHLTTFDLTRHGMVVAGHATSRLPQIVLEVRNDVIYAQGIVGLLYGYSTNPRG